MWVEEELPMEAPMPAPANAAAGDVSADSAKAESTEAAEPEFSGTSAWARLESSGAVTILAGECEMGQGIVNVCVAVLLVTVSLLQGIGSFLAARTTNRKLFRPKLHGKNK